MKQYFVKVSALAVVTQFRPVEAESEDEAKKKVMDSESPDYHGNHEWKYAGAEDETIEISVSGDTN